MPGADLGRRAERVDRVLIFALAAGYSLEPATVRRLLFWHWLFETGRIAGDDPVRPPAGVVWPLAEFLEVDRSPTYDN